MKGYPSWFKPSLVHTIFYAVFLSGLLLIPTALFSRFEFEIAWKLGSGSRVWVTALHTVGGMAIIWLVGALWSIHMRYWWRRFKSRVSGCLLLSLIAFLVATSIGVLYAGEDAIARFTSIAHVMVGLGVVLPYIWHVNVKRRVE